MAANDFSDNAHYTLEETSQPLALRQQLDEALPSDRIELLVGFVRDHVRRALRVTDEHPLGIRQRLMDLGFDSLMAVELRSKLSSGLGLSKTLPATLLFDYPTIDAMAAFLLTILEKHTVDTGSDEVEVERVEINSQPTPSDLTDLSDAEIEALLLKKLENI
jgi:hypothetical protein